MMKVSMIAHGITLVLLATTLPAAHTAGTWTEARNDAMDGTGVVSSGYTAVALANPALMTRHDANDDVGIILPSVGAQVSDSVNLRDGLDRVKDNWNRLNDAAGNVTAQPSPPRSKNPCRTYQATAVTRAPLYRP